MYVSVRLFLIHKGIFSYFSIKYLPINQLTLGGEIIMNWPNISEIALHFGLSKNCYKSIYNACRKQSVYKQYKWVWVI